MKLTARRSLAVTAAVALGATMFGLEISSVPVALPLIRRSFDCSEVTLQWVVTAYVIGSVTVLIAAGVIADRVGRRRMLLASVVGFGAASLLCGSAPDIAVLVACRFAQGVTGGSMMICGLAVLSHSFREGPTRARAFGVWGVGLGAGLGLGPVVGLGLIAIGGWRSVFLVHLVVAAVTVTLCVRAVPESCHASPGRLDVGGVITLAATLVAVVYFVSEAPVAGVTSSGCLAAASLTVVAVAAFVIVERRAVEPLVPPALFRVRQFNGALIGAVGMNVSFWPLIVYLPLYVEDGLGESTAVASVVLLGFTLPTFVLPPLAERLSLRFGPGRMIPVGLSVIGAGMLLLTGAVVSGAGWVAALPGALSAGTGLALTNTPVTNTTTSSVPAEQAGMASGVDLSARFTVLTVNIAVMGALFGTGTASTGFGRVALYGAVGVLLLALSSRLTFGSAR